MNKNTILKMIRSKVTKDQEWVLDNLQYLTIMGSHAYGLNRKESDYDVYGFTIPPYNITFPSSDGLIWGFDNYPRFDQFQGQFKEGPPNQHLDFQIYNITKYFKLVMDNNPNMIDSLFTPDNCVLVCTDIGKLVRDNRHIFLNKKCFHTFLGYSWSQLKKIRTDPESRKSPERKVLIEKYGYDTKFAVHLFRLIDECEQLLKEGTVNLQRNNEQHKLVREGFYTLPEIEQYFKKRESELRDAYEKSTLPYSVEDVKEDVRNLLVQCLDMFYKT